MANKKKKASKSLPPSKPSFPYFFRKISPLAAILALGFILRGVHFWIFKEDFWFKTPLLDDNLFVTWSRTIIREGWRAPGLGVFHLNPGYPYFLALLKQLLPIGHTTVFLFQHLLGAFIPYILYRITKDLFDHPTAILAAFISAVFGPAFFYETRFLGEFFIYFLNTLTLFFLIEKKATSWAFLFTGLAGFCIGLSTVFRPNVLIIVPLCLLWLAWSYRKLPIPRMGFHLLVFVVALWLPIFPFQWRNHSLDPQGKWSLTTASGGVNLFLGNNPEADGLNKPPSFVRYGPGEQYQDFHEEAERRVGKKLTAEESSRFWVGETMRWFKTHPKAAWRLIWYKMGYFWNYREPPDNFFPIMFERFTRVGRLPLIPWGLVAPLGLAGFLLSLRRFRELWLLHGYVFSYFFVCVGFYVLSRYRFPTVAGLIPFAAFGAMAVFRAIRAPKKKPLALILLTVAGSFWISQLRLMGEEEMSVTHYSMGVIYANQGQEQQAVESYRASIKEDPNFLASYINLGLLQSKRGKLKEAEFSFERAAQLERKPERKHQIEMALSQVRRGLKKEN